MNFSAMDDSEARVEAPLFATLDRLGIAHRTVRHTPAHTVDEAKHNRGDLAGGHAKNLFLKSKRDEYVLAVVQEDQPVDVQSLARDLGLGRLSFARPERMRDWLGVEPGSVTPFALINAVHHPNRDRLRVIVDQKLLDEAVVWFHPLHNAATTAISSADLVRFIEACGCTPEPYRFGA